VLGGACGTCGWSGEGGEGEIGEEKGARRKVGVGEARVRWGRREGCVGEVRIGEAEGGCWRVVEDVGATALMLVVEEGMRGRKEEGTVEEATGVVFSPACSSPCGCSSLAWDR